jgi:hypothetical protein
LHSSGFIVTILICALQSVSTKLNLHFYHALLGFSFFKSSSISIVVTAILFLFAFDMTQLLIVNFAQIEPWFILTYGSSIIGNVMSVPYPPHATTLYAGDTTFTMYNATIPEGLAIIAIYFAITAVLGLLLFERKEFN